MKNTLRTTSLVLSGLFLALQPLSSYSAGHIAKQQGVIYAKPENLKSNLPLADVLAVSAFFGNPENKVKIQFPSEQAAYAWQNMSKYYPTAQILRKGQVSTLAHNVNPTIGNIEYKNLDGQMVSVNTHFDTKPIDAMIVIKNGKIVYERYKTMRPDDKHIWYSVSKVTSATLLAFLEHEGKVDVSKPVSDYLTELKGSVWDT